MRVWLLHKFLPEIVIIAEQLERRGQAEIMTVIGQQLHAKRVDRAEESAIERRLNFRAQIFREQELPRCAAAFHPPRDWQKSRRPAAAELPAARTRDR